MSIGGQDDQTVHEYLLKADQYLGELKEVAKAIKKEQRDEKDLELVRKQLEGTTVSLSQTNAKLVKSMVDVKAGFDMAYGAAKKVAGVIDEVFTQGQKLDQLYKANTLSVMEAADATKGYISNMQLLTSANTAAEYKLGLSSAQFAKFAAFAAGQAQKLGGDANKMLDDLIVGTARGSAKILDNLTLLVKEGAAVEDVISAINAKMGSQGLEVKTAGDNWLVMKNQVSDASDELMRAVSSTDSFNTVAQATVNILRIASDGFKMLQGRVSDVSTETLKMMGQLGHWASKYGWIVSALLGSKVASAAKNIGAMGFNEFMRRKAPGAEAYTYDEPAQREDTSTFSIETGWTGGPGQGPAGALTERMLGWQGTTEHDERPVFGTEKKTASSYKQQNEHILSALLYPIETARVKLHDMFAEIAESDEAKAISDILSGKGKRVGMTVEEVGQLSTSAEWERWQKKTKAAYGYADAMAQVKDRSMEMAKANYSANQQVEAGWDNIGDTGTKVMTDFAGSIWAAADAAIMGSDSFGMAMAKMLKATLMSIAQESTVKAVFNLAEAAANWYNPYAVGQHLTAAALFGAVAVTAGAAGLATSAGIGAAGGYDTGSRTSTAARNGAGGANTYKAVFGKQTESNAPININVYLGDKGNPSTAMLLTKQIDSQLKVAA